MFSRASGLALRSNGIQKAMTTSPPTQPDIITRIEGALLLLAYFIELDGDVHVPMYEKFETELTTLRAAADVRARAGERLALYRQSGTGNAILSKNLSLSSSDGPLPYLGL
jgi:hypothetical protein